MATVFTVTILTDNNDSVSYVGFTTLDLEDRLKAHLADKGNTPKIDWIKKLKRLNLVPAIEKLEDVTEENWQDRERFWIAYFREAGFKLKNYTDGGETGPILKGTKQKPQHVKNAGMAKRKTTEEQDKKIKEEYLSGEKRIVDLAKEHNVNRSTIMRIVYGRINHYEEKPDLERKVNGKKKLTKEQVIEIRSCFKSNTCTVKELAKKYDIDPASIYNIINFKRYKNL